MAGCSPAHIVVQWLALTQVSMVSLRNGFVMSSLLAYVLAYIVLTFCSYIVPAGRSGQEEAEERRWGWEGQTWCRPGKIHSQTLLRASLAPTRHPTKLSMMLDLRSSSLLWCCVPSRADQRKWPPSKKQALEIPLSATRGEKKNVACQMHAWLLVIYLPVPIHERKALSTDRLFEVFPNREMSGGIGLTN